MKKIIILMIALVVLSTVVAQEIIFGTGEITDIMGDKIETKVNEIDIISPVEYNYVCGKELIIDIKAENIAECYGNEFFNTTSLKNEKPLLFSHAYDTIDKNTIFWTVNEKTGTYKEYINKTIQVKVGVKLTNTFINKDIIFNDCNVVCKQTGDILTCDSTKDGNGDGILQSGESGFSFNINKVNWYNVYIKSDSAWLDKLKGCIVQ